MPDFLHERRDFNQLLAVVADERGLDPMLVEKDYWIMHCLWGLQAQGFQFELKGGTSLSKGFSVIHRFSEDIDIRIEPPVGMDVKAGRNQDKPAHVDSRRAYYDELAARIRIPGIDSVERDTQFDDDKMRSAGIRLIYAPRVPALAAGDVSTSVPRTRPASDRCAARNTSSASAGRYSPATSRTSSEAVAEEATEKESREENRSCDMANSSDRAELPRPEPARRSAALQVRRPRQDVGEHRARRP